MTGIQAYILSRNLTTSIVSGIKTMNFDANGDLVIECMNGTIIKRPFTDIKKIEFDEQADGKHLVVEYSDGTSNDLGVFDPKFDINDLISVGTSADEATATTPLFINTDADTADYATQNDLNNLWKD